MSIEDLICGGANTFNTIAIHILLTMNLVYTYIHN